MDWFATWGLVAALVVAAYGRLAVPGGQHAWFDHWDLCQLEIPRLQFVAREIHQNGFPLWDPFGWAGQPVLGQAQPGPLAPLNLLFLYGIPHGGALGLPVLNLWFLALHGLAGGLCCWFCRRLGCGVAASAIGGLLFSAAGFLGTIPWLDIANGVLWTPLVYLALWLLFQGGGSMRAGALLGIALGASWLSGHHEVPLLNSYVAAASVAWAAIRRRSTAVALGGFGGLALAALIGAVQLLPMYEFGKRSLRWVGAPEAVAWSAKVPYEVHARYSLQPRDLPGIMTPHAVPETGPTLFLGFTGTGLALVALWVRRREPVVRFVAALAAISLVYALGASTPVHRLFYDWLPLLDKARTPVRGLYLFGFAASVLAALGAAVLLQRLGSAVAAVLLPGIVLVEMWRVTPLRMTALDGAAVCATDLLRPDPRVAELRRGGAVGRITTDDRTRVNLGDRDGLEHLRGFVAAVPANLLRHELHTPRTQDLFGVTHHLGREVESRPSALPRAWLVHRTETVDSEGRLRERIQDTSFDARGTALLLGVTPPVLEQCPGPDSIAIERPDTDTARLHVRTGCRGLAILSDTYDPGWKAWVNGRPAEILEVYGALRGVVVDSGSSTIEMRYRPQAVRAGAGFTLLGLLVAAAALLWKRRALAPVVQESPASLKKRAASSGGVGFR